MKNDIVNLPTTAVESKVINKTLDLFGNEGRLEPPSGKDRKYSTFTSPNKPLRQSKKKLLIGLLRKSNGTRISVLCQKLGWQAHSVRSALSRLREEGVEIVTSTSPKTGGTIYRIISGNRQALICTPAMFQNESKP